MTQTASVRHAWLLLLVSVPLRLAYAVPFCSSFLFFRVFPLCFICFLPSASFTPSLILFRNAVTCYAVFVCVAIARIKVVLARPWSLR